MERWWPASDRLLVAVKLRNRREKQGMRVEQRRGRAGDEFNGNS